MVQPIPAGWKAPNKRDGTPCRVCRPGRLCRTHRTTTTPPRTVRGARPKLTPQIVDAINQLAPTASGHEDLWRAANVHPATWYRWLDEGEQEAQAGKTGPMRDLYELVRNHRRNLAQRLVGTAVKAANGYVRIVTDPVTGKVKELYEVPPDGRLAAQLASRLDPRALPPERQELTGPEGGPVAINLAADARKRLQSLFDDEPKKP